VVQQGALPKPAKIAVLRLEQEDANEAFQQVLSVLDDAGYSIVYREPIAQLNFANAVEKVKAVGATHVINLMPFAYFGQFPALATKAGLTLRYVMLGIGPTTCDAGSARQIAFSELDGATCVTHWNDSRLEVTNIKTKDTAFEAQCRADFEKIYRTQPIGKGFSPIVKTNPGVPYPGLKDATGKFLDMDQSYRECTLANLVTIGVTGAGPNLTKETFRAALYAEHELDAAGVAAGVGTLAPGKPWLAAHVQSVRLAPRPDGSFAGAADANGVYGSRCLTPMSCFRVAPNTIVPLTYTL
jgi:hypothetical protein